MSHVASISLYVTDLDMAAAFYQDVLGFQVASRPAPGLIQLQHEGPAVILCQAEAPGRMEYGKESGTVVGVVASDLDGRVRDLTAKKVPLLTPAPQEFPGGRFIAIKDPSGNVIELLEFGG